MARKITVHIHGARAVDADYHRDADGKFAEGDRVKASANYGGKAGHIESTAPSGAFHVVKHDDGTKASYHESDLSRHEDDEDDDGGTRDAGFDESKVKRDDGGKFSTQTGKTGRGHHEEMVKRHAAAAEDPSSGASTALRQHHERAGYHHQEAIAVLNKMDAGPDHARRSHVGEYQKHVMAGWQHEAAIAARNRGAASAKQTREVGAAMARMDKHEDALHEVTAVRGGEHWKEHGEDFLAGKPMPASARQGLANAVAKRITEVKASGDRPDLVKSLQALHADLAPKSSPTVSPEQKPMPRFTPMRQANRNLQAQQLRADRKIVKSPQDPNRLKSVQREGAEANVSEKIAEIRKRLGAKSTPVRN